MKLNQYIRGVSLLFLCLPLVFCGNFEMSTFFYHYSILEEYCNDTIILEGITFLETATNASKSTIANQATSGMCMKHFSIGTEKMLDEGDNPNVIKLPENTMGMFAEITYRNWNKTENYTIVVNLTSLEMNSYTSPRRYTDLDGQFALDISFQRRCADNMIGQNCDEKLPISVFEKAVIALSVILVVLFILVVVVAAIVMRKVQIKMAQRPDCRPKWFNRYFIDPRQSRKEQREDVESGGGTSIRSRLHTRLTLINGSLYFWKPAGNDRNERAKKSAKREADDPYENDYDLTGSGKKAAGILSLHKKDHIYEDCDTEGIQQDTPGRLSKVHGSIENIYEEHESNGTILSLSHLPSFKPTETQEQVGNDTEVIVTGQESESEQMIHEARQSDEVSGKKVKPEKKPKPKKQDKKQKKMLKDKSTKSKSPKKKDKAKKDAAKDTTEDTVLENVGADVDVTNVQAKVSDEEDSKQLKISSEAANTKAEQLSSIKKKIVELEQQTSKQYSVAAELNPQHEMEQGIIATAETSTSPSTNKPKPSANIQSLIGGLDGQIPPAKSANQFSYLSGGSANAETSEEISVVKDSKQTTTKPDEEKATSTIETDTSKTTFGEKLKANIGKVFRSRESANLDELVRSTDGKAKKQSLLPTQEEIVNSKPQIEAVENKKSSQSKDSDKSKGTEEVEGKDGYVDISVISRRKTEKRVDSPDHDNDGYMKTTHSLTGLVLPLKTEMDDDVCTKPNMAYAAETFGKETQRGASTRGDYDYVSDKSFLKFRKPQ